jgi:hypothetical protein
MHDPASELRRIHLPRTRVNRARRRAGTTLRPGPCLGVPKTYDTAGLLAMLRTGPEGTYHCRSRRTYRWSESCCPCCPVPR